MVANLMSVGRASVWLLSIFAIAGCGHQTTAPTRSPSTTTSAAAESRIQFTVQWVDSGVLDLMSPEATFLRAFVESEQRAILTHGRGMSAIEAGGFPGFARAFNNVIDPDRVGGAAADGKPHFGTVVYEVIDIRREGDRYHVVYCDYESLTAIKVGDQYSGLGSEPSASAGQLTFGPDPALPPEQQRVPRKDQKGPARVPVDNVFGTWVATPGSEYMDDATAREWYPKCHKWAPGTPADWPRDNKPRPTPPPTLPPSPGWPPGSSA